MGDIKDPKQILYYRFTWRRRPGRLWKRLL